MNDRFPDFIRALPRPDTPLPLEAYLIPSDVALSMFYEATDDEVEVSEHVHGDQWGVVLSGEVDVTISGETHTYFRGDTYFIPAGVPHAALVRAGSRGIDVFADHDRYRPQR
jgi:hypothetical protein